MCVCVCVCVCVRGGVPRLQSREGESPHPAPNPQILGLFPILRLLIISAKMVSQNKVTFTGNRGEDVNISFWGTQLNPQPCPSPDSLPVGLCAV